MTDPRRVLITGGASGIGASCVHRFASTGDRVVSLDRGGPTGDKDRGGTTVIADIGDPGSAVAGVDEAAKVLGGLDILVCSAGVDRPGSVADTTLNDWDHVMAVNLRGVFLCAKTAISYFRRGGGGAIVIIASQMGLVGGKGSAAYSASKAGAISLARSIAIDHGREGVRANAVCPGPTLTPMFEQHCAQTGDAEAARERSTRMELHGRLIEPEEIAEAVWYLASPLAASTLGTALVVDGGYVAH
jgi:NAD(P)-dependent dehydrogenase (short-subunit alcohol dehydrogenase family)